MVVVSGYVANRGNKYTLNWLKVSQKSIQVAKVSYPNPIAIPSMGLAIQLWQYVLCVQLVTQYLVTTEFDDDTVQAIMDED